MSIPVTLRTVKGDTLTYTELDNNFSTLANANVTITAGGAFSTIVADGSGFTFANTATVQATMSGNVISFASNITSGAGKLSAVVGDTAPQLGGNLDINGKTITSVSNGNIAITPNGTGSIILEGQKWPQTDGTAGQTLTTYGNAQLAWTTPTSSSTVYVTEYSTPGTSTWTKPAGVTWVMILCTGSGGGGGSGRRAATTTARAGGGGGGGAAGPIMVGPIRASTLASTVAFTVGTGGAGGAAQTVNDTNGTAGNPGEQSYWYYGINVLGASGGGAGTTAGGSGGGGRAAANYMYAGLAGGAGAAGAAAGGGSANNLAYTACTGGGGGAGAGANITTTVSGGNNGQYSQANWSVQSVGGWHPANGGGLIADGQAGSTTPPEMGEWRCGMGGGGGGYKTGVVGGAGGAGGLPGGGGGGGSASDNGFNSGAGGKGGNAQFRIISW